MTSAELQLHASLLQLILQRREEAGDQNVGSSIEHCIVDRQLRDLEEEILADPGALEQLLVPVRRRSMRW